MKKTFADNLYKLMKKDEKVYLLTGDLGFKLWDKIKEDFPERYINCGAGEQAMMGIAVGLAQEGKIPFVYSITSFLLGRPFEWIRNYLNHENTPVKLVGSGRDKDYAHDEFTHFATDTKDILNLFPNIVQFWPDTPEGVVANLSKMHQNKKPSFISLKR